MDVSKENIKTEEIEIDDQLSIKIENCFQTDENLSFNIKKESLHTVCNIPDFKKEADGELLLEGMALTCEAETNNKMNASKEDIKGEKIEIDDKSLIKIENCYQTDENFGFNIKKESLHTVCNLPDFKKEDDADGELLLEGTAFNCEDILKFTNQSKNHVDASIFSTRKPRKTQAEYQKAYREREKAKKQERYDIKQNFGFNIKKESLHTVCNLADFKKEDDADGELLLEGTAFNCEDFLKFTNQSKNHVDASYITSPPTKRAPKTNAQRQREFRLRKKSKLKNDNCDKPAKITRAEYQRQYRLKKKLDAELKSDSVKMILRHEAGSSEYLAPATTTPLTQLSPDPGPVIIQHQAVIETAESKKKAQDQLEKFNQVRKLKRLHQRLTEDENLDEICQLPSQPIPTSYLPDNQMLKLQLSTCKI